LLHALWPFNTQSVDIPEPGRMYVFRLLYSHITVYARQDVDQDVGAIQYKEKVCKHAPKQDARSCLVICTTRLYRWPNRM